MEVDFVLSQSDGRPIYVQIMEHVKQRIAVGDWPPATKLPSIRELAVSLHISVITVKRAYLELERSGVIVTQQGRGSWISDRQDLTVVQYQELDNHLERSARLARILGIGANELVARLARHTNHPGDKP